MCPEGLNRGLEPVQISILQLPMYDMNTLGRPVHESLELRMYLPQAMPSDKMPFFPGPCKVSTAPSSSCLAGESPNEEANCIGMATKLRELLSLMVLDTSGPASGDSTPRRPTSVAWVTPSTIRQKDLLRPDQPDLALPKLVTISQQVLPQVARPDVTIPVSHLPSSTVILETPKATSVPAILQPRACPGMDPSILSNDVLQLQEKMNRAIGCLPITRESMDAHHRKQLSDFKTAFHQNKAQTIKVIKDVRAQCVTAIWRC